MTTPNPVFPDLGRSVVSYEFRTMLAAMKAIFDLMAKMLDLLEEKPEPDISTADDGRGLFLP